MPWAIKHRSNNRLDGDRSFLQGRYFYGVPKVPEFLEGYSRMVFKTRRQAREFITDHYGYIRRRPDLRAEPHGWKMPVPVKVTVYLRETV